MRPSLLFALSIFVGIASLAQAKSPPDGGNLFVDAYVKAQQGEKEEQAGHLDIALSKLKEAARMLDEVGKKFPLWAPTIVKYRKTRTADAIARVEDAIAKSKPSHGDKSGNGAPSTQERAAAPKDRGGFHFDDGIFVPLDNPRWRGW